jgi:hypothetical protein
MYIIIIFQEAGPSWPWSYGNWIYNYLCNQCLSPLMLWIRIPIRAKCTTLCDNVCQWLATGWWFSPGTPVFFPNKTDRHDITGILLKVALNTIKPKPKHKLSRSRKSKDRQYTVHKKKDKRTIIYKTLHRKIWATRISLKTGGQLKWHFVVGYSVCALFFFISSCVPYAASFSGLSIFDWSFSIL